MARRNTTRRIIGLALLAGGAFAAGRLGLIAPNTPLTPQAGAAQPEHDHDKDRDDMGGGMGGMEMDDDMMAWMEAGTPSEHHENLAMMAGSWKVTGSFYMDPQAPPMLVDGSSESQWVLGGRYMQSNFQADMMGMPFEGISYMGYDNIKGQYFSSWMDSMSTGMWTDSGSLSNDGKSITLWGEMTNPDRSITHTRHVITLNNDDQYTMEFFEAPANETSMRKTGELVYTRE